MGILDKEFIRQFITNDEKFIKDTKGKDIKKSLEAERQARLAKVRKMRGMK